MVNCYLENVAHPVSNDLRGPIRIEWEKASTDGDVFDDGEEKGGNSAEGSKDQKKHKICIYIVENFGNRNLLDFFFEVWMDWADLIIDELPEIFFQHYSIDGVPYKVFLDCVKWILGDHWAVHVLPLVEIFPEDALETRPKLKERRSRIKKLEKREILLGESFLEDYFGKNPNGNVANWVSRTRERVKNKILKKNSDGKSLADMTHEEFLKTIGKESERRAEEMKEYLGLVLRLIDRMDANEMDFPEDDFEKR
ncbi:hypothetical protein Dalk_2120 [Desulfatibacillum aliphaticivorans]|uniref:Uncharacterized protein n=2 Tax=Desulfatibacillum aliphaticivorans TaxID=218208 RepID=B8FGD4_DESAL|nr:hypothetical protein Dalk_2120 [Desulfatibacillum aliphaticivorans]